MTTLNLNSLIADLEASTGLQKTASDAGADVKPAVSQELASILEKKASDDLTKQAFAQGEALAKELLAKLANEIIENDAALVADDNKKVVDNATENRVGCWG
jgi:hypothetical protein